MNNILTAGHSVKWGGVRKETITAPSGFGEGSYTVDSYYRNITIYCPITSQWQEYKCADSHDGDPAAAISQARAEHIKAFPLCRVQS